MSDLVGRAMFAARAGLSFDGKRDLFTALGYPTSITPRDYRAMYDRNEVAGRVVDAFPEATWLGGAELIEDEDPEVMTPFEEAWDALADRLQVWPMLQRADTLAGMGRYSVVLIGAADGASLAQPMGRLNGPESVAYLSVWPEDEAIVGKDKLVSSPKDQRYGQPMAYDFRHLEGGRAVHWTRVLHVADGLLLDSVYGTPRLRRVYNRLMDLEKVVGGGSEAFWQRVQQGMQLNLDANTELTEDEENKLETEIDEYVHGLRRFMRTRGLSLKMLGSDVSAFDRQVDSLLTLIASGTKIPKRILAGSEMGELASTQDRENWGNRISERRTGWAGPFVVRVLVDRLIEFGALPEPESYDVRWPEVRTLTDDDRAALGERIASMNQKQGETIVTVEEIRDRVFGYGPLKDLGDDGTDDDEDADADNLDEDEDEEGAVARAAAEPEWRGVHRVADARVSVVRRAFLNAAARARTGVRLSDLAAALADKDAPGSVMMLDAAVQLVAPRLEAALYDALLDTLSAGAASAGGVVLERQLRAAAADGLVFDSDHPEAARWARRYAANLVRDISDDARAAIRAAVGRAIQQGIPPRDAARLIRPVIGLTEKQAAALMDARPALLNARPGSVVRLGKRRVRVPKRGMPTTRINAAVRAYADRMLAQRALLIARTETMRASNEGQRQLWRQAVERGDLTGTEERTWIAAADDRSCPQCLSLDGQRAPLDGPFSGGIDGPPAHPACRCVTGLVEAARRQRAMA